MLIPPLKTFPLPTRIMISPKLLNNFLDKDVDSVISDIESDEGKADVLFTLLFQGLDILKKINSKQMRTPVLFKSLNILKQIIELDSFKYAFWILDYVYLLLIFISDSEICEPTNPEQIETEVYKDFLRIVIFPFKYIDYKDSIVGSYVYSILKDHNIGIDSYLTDNGEKKQEYANENEIFFDTDMDFYVAPHPYSEIAVDFLTRRVEEETDGYLTLKMTKNKGRGLYLLKNLNKNEVLLEDPADIIIINRHNSENDMIICDGCGKIIADNITTIREHPERFTNVVNCKCGSVFCCELCLELAITDQAHASFCNHVLTNSENLEYYKSLVKNYSQNESWGKNMDGGEIGVAMLKCAAFINEKIGKNSEQLSEFSSLMVKDVWKIFPELFLLSRYTSANLELLDRITKNHEFIASCKQETKSTKIKLTDKVMMYLLVPGLIFGQNTYLYANYRPSVFAHLLCCIFENSFASNMYNLKGEKMSTKIMQLECLHALVNHDCKNTFERTQVGGDGEIPMLIGFNSISDAKAGEELTFSYVSGLDYDKNLTQQRNYENQVRKFFILVTHGVGNCKCESCKNMINVINNGLTE